MLLVKTAAQLDAALEEHRRAGHKVGFVPTMGALHNGHLSLVHLAKNYADVVVVSIFVNPKQFGAGEDFEKYPRTLEADCEKLDGAADIVFAPSVGEVYPVGQTLTSHEAGKAGLEFEGAARPGHFDGMLTVVARLFDMVQPNVAVFGEKDAQQLFLVRQLATNHYPQIKIVGAEIVREPSGLAMSSRNRYLNNEQLDIAEILAITLASVSQLVHDGVPVATALAIGHEMVAGEPETKLEYLALVNPATFERVDENYRGKALLLVAAIVGGVRLIDNHTFDI